MENKRPRVNRRRTNTNAQAANTVINPLEREPAIISSTPNPNVKERRKNDNVLLAAENALLKRELELLRRENEVNIRESTYMRERSDISFRMSASEVNNVIPRFNGSSSNATEWVKIIDDLRVVYSWDERATLFYATSQLEGAAKFWHNSQRFSNWEEFKRNLLLAFPSHIDESAVHLELMTRRWNKTEPVESYFYHMVSIAKKASLAENSVINYIISGLNDRNLINVLVATNCNTLTDLLSQIKKFESISAQEKCRDNLISRKPISSRYFQSVHERANPSVVNRKRSADIESDKQSKHYRQYTNASTQNFNKFLPGNCYRCGQKGHRAFQCQQLNNNSRPRIQPATTFIPKGNENYKQSGRMNIISATNEYNRYVELDGISLFAFLDLGSIATTIRETDAKVFKPFFKVTNASLIGFGGCRYHALAQFKKPLKIDNVLVEIDVMVVPDSCQETQMIVGQNFWDAKGIQVIKQNGRLEVTREHIDNSSPAIKNANCNAKQMIITRKLIEPSDVIVGEAVGKETLMELVNLLNRFRNAVAVNVNELGKTDSLKMTIEVKSDEIVRYKPYRVPYGQIEELQKLVNELLENDIIESSTSEYSSPVVIVKKKDGSLRMCVDYRKLNSITKRENFPTPNVEEQLNGLTGKSVFTTMDLLSGYYQVPIAEQSKHLTSFVTPDGQYQFKRMPFGLTNAPAIFMRLMSNISKKMTTKNVNVYMDDIVLSSADIQSNLEVLEEFLKILSEEGLTINLKKCVFFANTITYLGHEITQNGISPGNAKIKAVSDFPEPTTVKEVREFLGLSGYFRKFVPNYACIAAPLNHLLRKSVKFQWNQEQRDSFMKLKEALCSQPVLVLYNPNAQHEVHTDASSVGISGILMQITEHKNIRPVAYFSRSCSEQEAKWTSFELEALAVVESLERFKYYPLNKKFTILTDCNALKASHSKRDLLPKHARWWLKIQEFEFDIKHRPKTQNKHADALSRNPVEKPQEIEEASLPIMAIGLSEDDWIATLQYQDPELSKVRNILDDEIINTREKRELTKQFVIKNRRLYRKTEHGLRFVVPKGLRWRIIRSAHDDMGHAGIEKTIQFLQENYWFKRLRSIVKKYVESCIDCLYNKRGKDETRYHLHPIEKVCIPFHTIHLDHVGPFPRSKRSNCYILGIIDAFTKFTILRAVKNTNTNNVIKTINDMSQYFGVPVRIITDRGSAFTSKAFKSFTEENGIIHIATAVRTPRANGQIERVFRVVNTSLACSTKEKHGKDWEENLTAVQWGLNNHKHRVTGRSPHELLFGYKPHNIMANKLIMALQADLDEDKEQDEDEINAIRKKASEQIASDQKRQADKHNSSHRHPTKYNVGDMVLAQKEHPSTGQSRKLLCRYGGPYEVVKVLPNDRYQIENPEMIKASGRTFHSVYAADKLKPWCNYASIAYNDVSSDEEDDGINDEN